MCGVGVVETSNGFLVTSFDDADKLVVIDLDSGDRIVLDKPRSLDELELFIERYDPVILFCKSISSDYELFISEHGVKVISGVGGYLDRILHKVIG